MCWTKKSPLLSDRVIAWIVNTYLFKEKNGYRHRVGTNKRRKRHCIVSESFASEWQKKSIGRLVRMCSNMHSQNNNKPPPKARVTVVSELRMILYRVVYAQCWLLLFCLSTPTQSHDTMICRTHTKPWTRVYSIRGYIQYTYSYWISVYDYVGDFSICLLFVVCFGHWNAVCMNLYSIEKAYSHQHIHVHHQNGHFIVCVKTYPSIFPLDWHMVGACLLWSFPVSCIRETANRSWKAKFKENPLKPKIVCISKRYHILHSMQPKLAGVKVFGI